MIQPGAYVVHGWGEANSYAVFFCTGNMGLRAMAEAVRDDPDTRVLLVDRSRADGRYPLFYADLAAYDELVCHMVRRGEFERHNFEELPVAQVAERVVGPDGIWPYGNTRWYLKETADHLDFGELGEEGQVAAEEYGVGV